MPSASVLVKIDLNRVRENVAAIAHKTGVDIIAVVKADGYGLGAHQVAGAIADQVAGFCVFSLKEAIEASLWEVANKPILTLSPRIGDEADDFHPGVRPAVWTVDEARRLGPARPVLCVDTGMRRFACPPDQVDAVISAGGIDEAFTHAVTMDQVQLFISAVGNRGLRLHAAASTLLDEPDARLNAVRPGLAIYRGAARVSSRLVETRDGRGLPAGYTQFTADRFGVILCGYSHGLRRGPCVIAGQRRKVLEVGMQSAFVEIASGDRVGDEVVLLGEGLAESEIAAAWQTSEQQVLVALTGAGIRSYVGGGS